MLKRSIIWWQLLHGPKVHNVSDRLNQLLNPQGKLRSNVNKDGLKAYLRGEVMPIMEGDSFDSVLPAELVKRDLCLLCREAAYSAAVLEANPNGPFVKALVKFISNDPSNMKFVERMTTTQVSKVIEFLTYIQLGFSDAEKCFAVLVARLNFKNLQNVSRVMFCLSERGYTDLNIRLIVPAYPGGKWPSTPVGDNAQYSPPAEAVRILRALSKSTRMYIEKYYPFATTEEDLLQPPSHDSQKGNTTARPSIPTNGQPFPLSSFHIFRNHIIEFVLTHSTEMRGAHWVNFSRALLNFPPCLQTLSSFQASPDVLQRLSVHISGGGSGSHPPPGGMLHSPVGRWKCVDVAEYAIANVFAHVGMVERSAEGKHTKHSTLSLKPEGKAKEEGEEGSDSEGARKEDNEESGNTALKGTGGEKSTSHAMGIGALAEVRDAFDCNPGDLLKLLQQLAAFPSSPTMNARIHKLVHCLLRGSPDLSFENLVKLLSVVRSLPCVPHLSASAPEIAKLAGEKLSERPAKVVLRKEKFSNIVQLAIMIYACRIKDVPGFVEFMRNAVTHISPRELTLDYVVSILNSLSVLKTRPTDGSITLNLVNKVVENTSAFHPLLKLYPDQAVKMMRAFVLQSITPTVFFLEGLFGKAGVSSMYLEENANVRKQYPQHSSSLQNQQPSPLFEAGAVSLFDIGRSLAYVGRHSREVQRLDLQQVAWEIGFKRTVLPILLEWNHVMRCHPSKKDYVPLSWRCTLEVLSPYLDVTLDSHSLEVLTTRLTSVYDSLKLLLAGAAVCTHKQLSALLSLSTQGRKDRLPRIAFKNNTMIHFLSSMLSFEYYLFQAAWQETQHYQQLESQKKSKVKDGNDNGSTNTNDSSVSPREENSTLFPPTRPLATLLEDYKNNFLYKQVQDIEDPRKSKVLPFSPIDVIRKIFYDDEENSELSKGKKVEGSSTSAAPTTGAVSFSEGPDTPMASTISPTFIDSSSQNLHSQPPLLNREQILEITTHLPFSIALVMKPGPLNEYFTEKAYSAMVAGIKI